MRCFLYFTLLLLCVFSASAIYDGGEAKPHQFPYAVLVHSPQFFCTGAIISDRHILTAAHCLMSIRKGGKAVVNIGVHEYYGGGFSDGETISSSKFWVHENFSMPSAVFDIGLIELNSPLNFSERIQPVKISSKKSVDLDAEDKSVYLAGWGYTFDHSGAAESLRYTNMTLIPLSYCKNYKLHYVEEINNDHICAVKTKGMPCSGDSGAAVISRKTNKIVGILSYVKDADNGVDMHYNDCVSDIPVVSTRVSSYLNWISNKTGLHFEEDFEDENLIDHEEE